MFAAKTFRPTQRCKNCGGEWDLEACYRKNKVGQVNLTRRICAMCELTARNDPTPQERAQRKAYGCIVSHAKKYKMAPGEFAKHYGWNVERMAYDILHGHENTCPYCYENFASMGHGLRDIELDVVDLKSEPYYHTNIRWCCATCNREKSQMASHLWAIRCTAWRLWARRREAIAADQTYDLPLFMTRQLGV